MRRRAKVHGRFWSKRWSWKLWHVVGLMWPLDHLHLLPLANHANSHSGRAYSPRFLWMWPNAKIGVMGSQQLSAVMEAVGKTVDPDLQARIERESDAVFSSAQLWDDGVVPPAHTRRVLGLGLQASQNEQDGRLPTTRFGVFRM